MATRNPFGQLRVDRDDDEEVTQTVTKTTTSTPLFANPQATEQKKKKKVRPDEKKKSEEPVAESNEGFEVVGKQKQRNQRTYNAVEEEEVAGEVKIKSDKHANKVGAGHQHHGQRPVRSGKRQFERHSGTGRGKEVAKGGAGGKTVWGDNPEVIAKQSLKEEYSRDDHYFDSVLNPRPRRVKEEVTETPVVEEPTPIQETPAAEEETPVAAEENQERKKKVVEEKPINPEDLLEVPENALSLAEYREQLKEKNRKILGTSNATTLKVELPSDLKKLEKDTFGVKAAEKKPAAKPAKKENVVQEIAVAFKTEDSSFRRNDRNDYGKKKSKPAPKLRFEDLPSL